jgi:hypothetical protein
MAKATTPKQPAKATTPETPEQKTEDATTHNESQTQDPATHLDTNQPPAEGEANQPQPGADETVESEVKAGGDATLTEDTETEESETPTKPLSVWETMPRIEGEDGTVLVPLQHALIAFHGQATYLALFFVSDTTPYWNHAPFPVPTQIHEALGLAVELSAIKEHLGVADEEEELVDEEATDSPK